MSRVVLLGDSIFDNRVYVSPEPDVRHQLKARLGTGWGVTLLAVDGDVTADVKRQLHRVPRDASHLVVSVTANDVWLVEAVPSRFIEAFDPLTGSKRAP